MSSYIEQSLSTGESIEQIIKLHWSAWIPTVVFLILGLVTFGITLPIALYLFLKLKCTEQGLTNKRIILKTGIISRKTQEMRLKAIETVEIDQSLLGRIFGFGTVKITGRGTSDVVFQSIEDPVGVKRGIEGFLDID